MKLANIFLSATIIFCLQANAETGVVAQLNLSPAGNFQAKSAAIKGKVIKTNDSFTAKNIEVDLATLNTGISLRDEHMKNKYLEIQKFPKAELTEASGKDGKGSGKLKIKNIEKEISGTYKVISDKEIEAKFNIKLSDYEIKGIRYLGVGVKDEAEITVTLPVQ